MIFLQGNKSFIEDIKEICIEIYTEEGVKGLFAGTSPRILRSFLSGTIQFATYELVKQIFGENVAKSLKKK